MGYAGSVPTKHLRGAAWCRDTIRSVELADQEPRPGLRNRFGGILRRHEIAYWVIAALCLVPAGICVAGVWMNLSLAAGSFEDAIDYRAAARYWAYGIAGFLALGAGFAVNAAMLRRKRLR